MNWSVNPFLSNIRKAALSWPQSYFSYKKVSAWSCPSCHKDWYRFSVLVLGTVPSGLKQAVVTPLSKKLGLGLKKFRPVSNLPFISKILGESSSSSTAVQSFHEQLTWNWTVKNHSTDIAILGALESLFTKLDDKLVSILALLDLSAAFDTRWFHPVRDLRLLLCSQV